MPKHSACIPGAVDTTNIRIEKDHINMVKFSDVHDEDFQRVGRHVKFMLQEAAAKVEDNWRRQDNKKKG